MERGLIPPDLQKFPVHFVGIKGTGMAAMAELFFERGARISGSDTEERFYTDEVLEMLGIPYKEGFDTENLPEDTKLLIHSAAYDSDVHPEILKAKERGIAVVEYTEALGELSKTVFSVAVAGVHGKTTTTALIGNVCKEAQIPAYVLVGSAVRNFGGRSTYFGGEDFFVAETCEYRRHFLSFSPDLIVITTVDADHLDYYEDESDVHEAFLQFGERLSEGGTLVYCSDDEGATETAGRLKTRRPDLRFIPYGFSAEGSYRIGEYRLEPGEHRFKLGEADEGRKADEGRVRKEGEDDEDELTVRIPGRHSVLNAVAAVAVGEELIARISPSGKGAAAGREDLSGGEYMPSREGISGGKYTSGRGGIRRGIEHFSGSKRRSEILGEQGGIIFADDYGHHPREVRETVRGFKEFYPDRRIIVDFMSHTYTRTEAFLEDFAEAFDSADEVILHKIYASAREKEGEVDGETLFHEVQKHHPDVKYFLEVMDAYPYLLHRLRPGDLFLTMGAGNNWRVGEALKEAFSEEEHV